MDAMLALLAGQRSLVGGAGAALRSKTIVRWDGAFEFGEDDSAVIGHYSAALPEEGGAPVVLYADRSLESPWLAEDAGLTPVEGEPNLGIAMAEGAYALYTVSDDGSVCTACEGVSKVTVSAAVPQTVRELAAVYDAEYGVTTAAEAAEAHRAGLTVRCRYPHGGASLLLLPAAAEPGDGFFLWSAVLPREAVTVMLDGEYGWSAESTPLWGTAAERRSLIDNGWFQINQRGWSSGAASGYTVDRWKLRTSNILNVTANSDGTLTLGAASVAQGFLEQRLEADLTARLAGKTITLSADVTAITGTWQARLRWMDSEDTNIADSSAVLKTKGVTSVSAAVPSDAACGILQICNSENAAGSSITLRAVKAELGGVSTLADDFPPEFGAELLRCQRYAHVYDTAAARPAKAADCAPAMRADPTQSTVTVGGVTKYLNSADL